MNKIFLTLTFFIFASMANAQGLYTPRNIKNSYKKGTRSPDGKPGPQYWQNKGRYDITISVNPPSRNIRGIESISYVNNSPDTLRNIVLKLILNIHKPTAVRHAPASPDYLTTGVHIEAVNINGKSIPWVDPNYHDTWQSLRLPQLLLPKDSVKIQVSWNFDASVESGREGMLDSSTYFLAYFYPRVAVYDDNDGWDRMPFTDAQEFYNDFNDYSLTVQAPANFIVWATGTLQNPQEVLAPEYYRKLAKSMNSDEIIRIADPKDLLAKKITAQAALNNWKWTASHITDVALTISDHYVWDASSVVVDKTPGRRVSVQAAYNDTAKDFHYMVQFGKHALQWLSNNWPGVAYPFPKTTIVQGFADMEYPMMVNDGTTPDTNFTRFVAEHELAHTWFPFYMGINEHRYGFMDEGWATAFEYLIGQADVGEEKAANLFRQFRVSGWIYDPSAEEDIPIITPGNILDGAALGNNEYGKAALGYLAVKDLLGDQEFRKCLHGFMERWHGKHPIPWDFFYSFNDIAGKDLNWFWNSWYFTNGYIDMALEGVEKTTSGYNVKVKNIGGFPAPFDLVVTYDDGTKEKIHQTPGIWEKNLSQSSIILNLQKPIQSVEIQGGIFMDADLSNNSWKK